MYMYTLSRYLHVSGSAFCWAWAGNGMVAPYRFDIDSIGTIARERECCYIGTFTKFELLFLAGCSFAWSEVPWAAEQPQSSSPWERSQRVPTEWDVQEISSEPWCDCDPLQPGEGDYTGRRVSPHWTPAERHRPGAWESHCTAKLDQWW